MNMYKVKYTDEEGVSCAIKIMAATANEAKAKAKAMRKGAGFTAILVRDDEHYASIKI